MKLRIIFILIMGAFLIISASCSSDQITSENKTEIDEEKTEIITESIFEYNIPEVKDFGKYEFRIGANDDRNKEHFIKVTDEQNGEVINDAVYIRNRNIEENYNIKIVGIIDSANTIDAKVKVAVLAGDDNYDIASIGLRLHFPLASEGFLIDLNTLESIDLTQQWWDQALLENFRIYGQNYIMTGDITTSDELRILIMLYNKKIYEDNNFENPYEMVSSGKWTVDRFWEMAQQVPEDINGDGVMDEDDRWGFLSEITGWYYYSTGCELMPIKNQGDEYIFTLDDEKTYKIIEKTMPIFLNKDVTFLADDGKYTPKKGGTIWDGVEAMFMENKGMFKSGNFNDVTRYRNMEVDFGILPMPKYDELQEEYYCLVTHHMDSYVIPTTVSDPERTALIVDALAYESMLTITPLFYEIFLDEKLARDQESKLMIDLIIRTKVYDLDWMVPISSLGNIMNTIAQNRTDTFASSWAAARPAAEASLEKFLSAFRD